MAILITGGTGYIGSHTAAALLEDGYELVILDNFSNSSPEVVNRIKEITGKQFKTYQADLLNAEETERVFAENEIEAVIHFAGLKAVGESVTVPLKYYSNNLTGTLNLCEAMQKHQVKKLVFSSSATVYGTADQMPVTETASLAAVNPYGRTKQMIEGILTDLYDSDNSWSIALLRYFNPVGAHPSGRIGEDPAGLPNNLLPYISQVAVGKLNHLTVFGQDYPTHDGTGIRDYIHVEDLAAGHLRALEKIKKSSGVESYNLGTGIGYSVLDMIQAFEQASGRNIPYTISGRRSGDAAVCYADVTKAKEQLDWQAQRGIREMCRDAWNWQQKNPNGYSKTILVQ